MIYSPQTLVRLFSQEVKYHWKAPYTYENLEWKDEEIAKPTEDEIAAVNDLALSDIEYRKLRIKRNQLLAETDYLALADATLTDEMRTYRQALRDLPANTADPANPIWPTKP